MGMKIKKIISQMLTVKVLKPLQSEIDFQYQILIANFDLGIF